MSREGARKYRKWGSIAGETEIGVLKYHSFLEDERAGAFVTPVASWNLSLLLTHLVGSRTLGAGL